MKQTSIETESTRGTLSKASQDWRSRACHSIPAAAEILDTPASTLRKMCRKGQLNPVTGLGRRYKLTTEEIERILAKRLRKDLPSAA